MGEVSLEDPDFSAASFWREQYRADAWTDVEWLVEYRDVQAQILRLMPSRDAEILIPGCGNSLWPIKMFQDGYKNLTCIDFAANCVTEMSARYGDLPIDWVEMDARELNLPASCCDIVLDKALLDCQACNDDAPLAIRALLVEMHRVLKRGGLYVLFSHGSPGTRLPHVRDCGKGFRWNVLETIKLPLEPVVGFDENTQDGGLEGQRYAYLYVFEKL